MLFRLEIYNQPLFTKVPLKYGQKRKKKMAKLGVVVFLLVLWSSFTEMETVLGEPLGGFSLLRKILLLEEKVNHHSVMKMTPQEHS